MTGADKSPRMLERAMAAAAKRGVRVPFALMDMERPELKSKYDFVTCCCDGFNYINPEKLDKTLAAIGEHIKPGGALIFDYSTSYKLNGIIGNNVFYEDLEDITYLWVNEPFKGGVKMRLTFFIREGGLYSREDEVHTQYVYEEDGILSGLDRAGFEAVKTLDLGDFGPVNSRTERIIVKAVKK
jgi:SAM-dependent methyltransferase